MHFAQNSFVDKINVFSSTRWRINMSNNHIEVKPVAGFIGAEISNVDLSRPLHDDAVKEIR